MAPPYHRRLSNEIELSLQLHQLRDLQLQLGLFVQDGNHEPSSHQDEEWIDEEFGLLLNGGSNNNKARRRSSSLTTYSTTTVSEDPATLSLHNNPPPLVAYKRRRLPQPHFYTSSGNLPPSSSSRTSSSLPINTTRLANVVECSKSLSLDESSRSRSSAISWSTTTNKHIGTIRLTNHTDPTVDSSEGDDTRCDGKEYNIPASSLPTYDFLQKEDDAKEGGGIIRPATKWWHGVFIFSLISMLACIITLWAPYPIGARMPTATIATMPFSNGCKGLQSCICPRATICADDLLSMIFLTIARSTAWFNYPLYMLLFLSKANNLNDFLQKTALRCWINFSDFHHVHTLFGIVVGLESASHSFFHLLRWARRKNDIQV